MTDTVKELIRVSSDWYLDNENNFSNLKNSLESVIITSAKELDTKTLRPLLKFNQVLTKLIERQHETTTKELWAEIHSSIKEPVI